MPALIKRNIALLSVTLVLFSLLGCHVLSTGSTKWKITWDEDLLNAKKEFLSIKKENPPAERPNIILIVADDLGKYEVSAYGATHIHTPNIDRLAAEGARFEQAYVTSPSCAPSRASMLTGRYQQRFGFETQPMEFYPSNMLEYFIGKNISNTGDWVMSSKPKYPTEWQAAKQGLPPTEINLAEILQKEGYATGITGKWHLGFKNGMLPLERGFDYQYGFYGAFSLYTPDRKTPGYRHFIQDDFSCRYQWKTGRNLHGEIHENGKGIREEQYLTFAVRDKAINFIGKNTENPFFLYIPFSAPHVPFQAPDSYYDKYSHIEDDNKRVYYAMISALDDAIGDINQAVKDMGLEGNTVIFLISDNGGATYTKATDNGPLKGGKLTNFEGGVNVPFIMKWKNRVPESTVYDKPVVAFDIFSTCAAASGSTLPGDREYDGVDLMPYILGKNEAAPHESIYWRAEHIQAARIGEWKFVRSIRDGWSHLYNLNADRSEIEDLTLLEKEVMEMMDSAYAKWNSGLRVKPLWPRIMDRKFVFGDKEYLFPA